VPPSSGLIYHLSPEDRGRYTSYKRSFVLESLHGFTTRKTNINMKLIMKIDGD
jgi:hypothetical protein